MADEEARGKGTAFRVDVHGLSLADEQKAAFTAAVQSAALSQLATIDTRGDTVAIAFPRLPDGSTQGIWIVPRDALSGSVDSLRRFGVPE